MGEISTPRGPKSCAGGGELGRVHATRRTRSPHLVAAVAGIHVEGEAAADVARALHAEDEGARARVAQLQRVRTVRAGALVRLEHLQPRPIGVHVGHVERVAVAEAGGIEAGAVVVDGRRAVDDLVLAVAVHVADA